MTKTIKLLLLVSISFWSINSPLFSQSSQSSQSSQVSTLEFKEVNYLISLERNLEVVESLSIEGKVFEVFNYSSKKGNKRYIKGLSKMGKFYPIWIGDPTPHSYNGIPVRKTKTYLYLKIGKSGFPYAVTLEVQ